MFNPSPYQQAIFNAYSGSNSNIIVNAAPGAGKTTTILQVLALTPKHKSVCFLAFNKSIVEELQSRVPAGIDVSTLHSLGMKSLMRHYRGQVKVLDMKTFIIAKDLCRKNKWNVPQDEMDRFLMTLADLVNIYRLAMASTEEDLLDLAYRHEIDITGEILQRTMETIVYLQQYNGGRMALKERLIDFTDMIYLPATMNIQLPQYDEVFVDECQDLNKAQQIIVEKITKSSGRTVCVGDRYQSIYSFMGADVQSFEKLASKPNTIQLPLSVTYRCAKSIVTMANRVYDNILPAPNAIDGEVRPGSIHEVRPGDFVLCRNTAPLVTVFYHLIGEEIRCHIKGKALGKNLISMVKKFRNLPLLEMLEELRGALGQIAVELAQKNVKKPTDHPRYVSYEERVSVVEAVAERYRYTHEVITALENMFSDDDKDGVILSTIHKSKGLEADRVFIIRRDLLPSKRATQPWQREQERNLEYVAYTRAKKSLIFATDVTEDGVVPQNDNHVENV